MSQPYEPYPNEPEQFGAAQPYYAPALAGVPKDLQLTGWLSVGAAATATVSFILDAILVGPAIRDTRQVEAVSLVYAANVALAFLLLVAGYVFTCLWLARARENAGLINPDFHHARRSGWIWGGWVCPIVNFWFPFQIVRDIYRATSRLPSASPVIAGWWTVWVVLIIASRIADRLASDALGGASGNGAEAASAVLAVTAVVCLVLWVQVVRQVTRAQHEALGLA